MSYSPRDPATVLDILLSARDAIEFLEGITLDAFLADRKTRSAVLHVLILIGEASRRLSLDFRLDHAEIPWVRMGNFRNLLIHEYDRVDLRLVWQIVTAELPGLVDRLAPLVPADPNEE